MLLLQEFIFEKKSHTFLGLFNFRGFHDGFAKLGADTGCAAQLSRSGLGKGT